MIKDGIVSVEFEDNKSFEAAFEDLNKNSYKYNLSSKDIYPHKFSENMLIIQLLSIPDELLEEFNDKINSYIGVKSVVCI